MSISSVSNLAPSVTAPVEPTGQTNNTPVGDSQSIQKAVVATLTQAQKKAEIKELQGQLPALRGQLTKAAQAFDKSPSLENLEKLLGCRNKLLDTRARLQELGVRLPPLNLRSLQTLGNLAMAPSLKALDAATKDFNESPTLANLEKLLGCRSQMTQTAGRLGELGITVGMPPLPTLDELGAQFMAPLLKDLDDASKALQVSFTAESNQRLLDCGHKALETIQGLAKLGIHFPFPDLAVLFGIRAPVTPTQVDKTLVTPTLADKLASTRLSGIESRLGGVESMAQSYLANPTDSGYRKIQSQLDTLELMRTEYQKLGLPFPEDRYQALRSLPPPPDPTAAYSKTPRDLAAAARPSLGGAESAWTGMASQYEADAKAPTMYEAEPKAPT